MVIQQYLKAIYGAVLAGLGALAAAYTQGHGHIGGLGIIGIVAAIIGALGVIWAIPGMSGNVVKYGKAFYGAVTAALGALATAYAVNGHIGYQAVVAIAITFVGALGVIWGVPNGSLGARRTA